MMKAKLDIPALEHILFAAHRYRQKFLDEDEDFSDYQKKLVDYWIYKAECAADEAIKSAKEEEEE